MNSEEVARRLRYRIAGDIHRESLRGGDRLPSIRELAAEWRLPARLVRTAYETLEREGIVDLKPRSGVYVAVSGAQWPEELPRTGNWLVGALLQARRGGIAPTVFSRWVEQTLFSARLRCACIESNEDQIAWLVYEATTDFGLDAFGIDLDTITAAELTQHVRSADVVLTTALHGEALESVARDERKPLVLLRLAATFVDPIARALRDGPLFFVVGDRRFAARLPLIYGRIDGGQNVRALVAGEDDLSVIPAGSAVYVTRAAELRSPEAGARRTVASPGRIFSDAMAEELLNIMLVPASRS